ncbi:MAG: hypothetical protein A2284_13890 [Deltaproteobacteria bacterium RIFOXYA12_FULL_61_11]|nr:MAG: hypothetical protein A2284_13890 [Deltaproteobacteria bacterium RIFOXYA12_FULL_61_11]
MLAVGSFAQFQQKGECMKTLVLLLLSATLALTSCTVIPGGSDDDGNKQSKDAPAIDQIVGNGADEYVKDGVLVLGENFTDDMDVYLVPAEAYLLLEEEEGRIDLDMEFLSNSDVIAYLNGDVEAGVTYKLFVQNEEGEDSEKVSFLKGEPGQDGQPGKAGVLWQGEFAKAPADPKEGWAYFNTEKGNSYIWNGDRWDLLARGIMVTAEDTSCLDATGAWICDATPPWQEEFSDWQTDFTNDAPWQQDVCFDELGNWTCGNEVPWEQNTCFDADGNWTCGDDTPWEQNTSCYDADWNWICAGPAPWEDDIANIDIPPSCYLQNGSWNSACGPNPLDQVPDSCTDEFGAWICDSPAPWETFHVVFPPPEQMLANLGEEYLFHIEALDPKLDDPVVPFLGLNYNLSSGPDGMFVTRTGDLRWVPKAEDAGKDFWIEVKVTNTLTQEVAHLNYSLKVIDPSWNFAIVSQPPLLTNAGWYWWYWVNIFDPENPNGAWIDGENYVLTVEATHPNHVDTHPMTHVCPFWNANPMDCTYGLESWNWGEVSFLPLAPTDLQNHHVMIRVERTEDGAIATQEFDLRVLEDNVPIYGEFSFITWPNPWYVVRGATYSYTAEAFDPDFPAATLQYNLLEGPTGAAINGATLTWTPDPSDDTIWGGNFRLQAKNPNTGATTTQEFWVDVLGEQPPPTFMYWNACQTTDGCFEMAANDSAYNFAEACDQASGTLVDWCDWTGVIAECKLYNQANDTMANFLLSDPASLAEDEADCALLGGSFMSWYWEEPPVDPSGDQVPTGACLQLTGDCVEFYYEFDPSMDCQQDGGILIDTCPEPHYGACVEFNEPDVFFRIEYTYGPTLNDVSDDIEECQWFGTWTWAGTTEVGGCQSDLTGTCVEMAGYPWDAAAQCDAQGGTWQPEGCNPWWTMGTCIAYDEFDLYYTTTYWQDDNPAVLDPAAFDCITWGNTWIPKW